MKKADNFDAKQWLVENKVTFQSRLNEGADKYPYQASPEKIALYDKIANELEKTISMIANKLGTSESNIRISLDYLWDDLKGNKAKKKGMSIQVKTDDAQWKEAWTGNALIMQTQNGEGIVIPSNPFFGIKVEGQKNPKVRSLFNKALDLDLEDLAASENARIADSLSPEEIKLIAPNTPVIVTGTQSRLNEDIFFPYQINDERGKELYTKYNKAFENPAWKNIDGNYELEIDLKTLLKITGMTLDELEELSNNYGDESWSIYVDKNKGTVTQAND